MPRSTVIANQISKYDKIINDNRTIPDTELAIFKLAICQLVDAAFSGGGGGGGTTAATVSSGIDAAVDIDTIITRLTSIDTKAILQADIVAAIQSAADIDTIITRLTSIATNTSSGTSSNVVTTYTPTNASINDTGVLAIAANAARKHAIIVNRSTTNTVDLFFGAIGLFGDGTPLLPQQSYEINNTNLYAGIVRAIAATGVTASLSVIEGI
jgi:hypothetical protein